MARLTWVFGYDGDGVQFTSFAGPDPAGKYFLLF